MYIKQQKKIIISMNCMDLNQITKLESNLMNHWFRKEKLLKKSTQQCSYFILIEESNSKKKQQKKKYLFKTKEDIQNQTSKLIMKIL